MAPQPKVKDATNHKGERFICATHLQSCIEEEKREKERSYDRVMCQQECFLKLSQSLHSSGGAFYATKISFGKKIGRLTTVRPLLYSAIDNGKQGILIVPR